MPMRFNFRPAYLAVLAVLGTSGVARANDIVEIPGTEDVPAAEGATSEAVEAPESPADAAEVTTAEPVAEARAASARDGRPPGHRGGSGGLDRPRNRSLCGEVRRAGQTQPVA